MCGAKCFHLESDVRLTVAKICKVNHQLPAAKQYPELALQTGGFHSWEKLFIFRFRIDQIKGQERWPLEREREKKKEKRFQWKTDFPFTITEIRSRPLEPQSCWSNCHQELSAMEEPANPPLTTFFILFVCLLLGWIPLPLIGLLLNRAGSRNHHNEYPLRGETQMGKSHFPDNPSVMTLNNVKLERQGSTVQETCLEHFPHRINKLN